jgi:hypothetical protein
VAAHEGPLVVVERAGLVEDGVGDRHLAHVVQLGGHAHVVERLALEAQVAAHGFGETRRRLRDGPRGPGWRSASARRRTSVLWRRAVARPEFLCAYMRWSAMSSASLAIVASLGDGDGAVGGGDGEAVAMVDQRGGSHELDVGARRGVGEDAELVASQPVGASVALTLRSSAWPRRVSSASPARWPKASL